MSASFDTDLYRTGGWRTAIDPACSHYERLGFKNLEHVTPKDVNEGYQKRYKWWENIKKKVASGQANNPDYQEKTPHISVADEYLRNAKNILSDVHSKSQYDRELQATMASAVEAEFRPLIRFALRDRVLTPSEKDDLLGHAHDHGIGLDRANALIQEEMTRMGAVEGEAPSSVPHSLPGGFSADLPRLVIDKTSLSVGILRRGDHRECKFTIDNSGGGVLEGSIFSSDPEWLILSQSVIDSRRHHQEIAFSINTSNLALGESYVCAVEVHSNGGRASIRIDFSIELELTATTRFRKQMFWMGLLVGLVFGLILYPLFPDAAFTPNTLTRFVGLVGFMALTAMSVKVWRGAGCIAPLIALTVGSILQAISMRAYSGVAWAMIVSAFMFFSARRLLIARLSRNARTMAWVAISGAGLVAIIVLIGLGLTRTKLKGEEGSVHGIDLKPQLDLKATAGKSPSQIPPSLNLQGTPASLVQIIGAFSNVRTSDATGETHAYGYEVCLYQEGTKLFGLFYSSQGLAGDTPRGRIQDVQYDQKSGVLFFRAKLTIGQEINQETGKEGRPSQDFFEFNGHLTPIFLNGTITIRDGYHPEKLVDSISCTLRLDPSRTKDLREHPPSSYESWLQENQTPNENEIPVLTPNLPEAIASFMRSRKMHLPNTIDKYCQFNFKTGATPFFVQGDFDGDGKLDYAIDLEENQRKGQKKVIVFLANGQIIELGGWDFIYVEKRRITIQAYEGKVTLKNDALGGVRCESSSVLYVYNKTKNAFDEFFTSD